MGLDSSSYAISVAMHATERRLSKWQETLAALPDGLPVELDQLTKSFTGINEEGGIPFPTIRSARVPQ